MTILDPYVMEPRQTGRRWLHSRYFTRIHPIATPSQVPILMSTRAYAGAGGPLVAAGRPLRVMIVEDEAIIAMDLEMTLEDLGAEIVCRAASAAEAVRLARQHRPDCATMDINIQGDRDGVSAAVELYEMLGIRSVFVSAFGDPEARDRAASANPIGWISKPFNDAELRRKLERFADDL